MEGGIAALAGQHELPVIPEAGADQDIVREHRGFGQQDMRAEKAAIAVPQVDAAAGVDAKTSFKLRQDPLHQMAAVGLRLSVGHRAAGHVGHGIDVAMGGWRIIAPPAVLARVSIRIAEADEDRWLEAPPAGRKPRHHACQQRGRLGRIGEEDSRIASVGVPLIARREHHHIGIGSPQVGRGDGQHVAARQRPRFGSGGTSEQQREDQADHRLFLTIRPSFMMIRKLRSGSSIRERLAIGSPSTSNRSAIAPSATMPTRP